MDHFAKPDDELANAQRTRRLHRNFQGYSTKPDCDLLGLGISAIGKIGTAYVQNVKTLDAYYTRLDAHTLPVMRGIELDADDIVRRDVIQRLMCDFVVEFNGVETRHAIHFIDYFAAELDALASFETDGLIFLSSDSIAVTPRGKWLVRSIAMTFDRRLREAAERARYSRVI
jgi:oxygen-independent coproporphyrinogen-3 oxidase